MGKVGHATKSIHARRVGFSQKHCGPLSFVSLTGFEYYVTFIDDFSRKIWIYFPKSKKSKDVL